MGKFQENLKRLRIEKGFKTAKSFAAAIDMPYTSYMNYENKNREPPYDMLCRIADTLHVTTDELLEHELDQYEKMLQSLKDMNFEISQRPDGMISLKLKENDSAKTSYFIFDSQDRLYKTVQKALDLFDLQNREPLKNHLVSYFYKQRVLGQDGIVINQGGLRERSTNHE